MIQSIIKRDGRVVLYDQNKIAAAILKALEAAHDQLEQGYSPELTALAGRILAKLTDGRYDGVILQRSQELLVRERDTALTRPPAALSSGTRDQVWLALRLAMTKLLLPPETPLILDDALLTFDPHRTAAAMTLLKEMGTQVINLRCK